MIKVLKQGIRLDLGNEGERKLTTSASHLGQKHDGFGSVRYKVPGEVSSSTTRTASRKVGSSSGGTVQYFEGWTTVKGSTLSAHKHNRDGDVRLHY